MMEEVIMHPPFHDIGKLLDSLVCSLFYRTFSQEKVRDGVEFRDILASWEVVEFDKYLCLNMCSHN